MYSSDEIPPTWLKINLGDVVDYGSTNKAEPNEISDNTWVLELEDIEKGTSKVLQKLKFSERNSKSTKNRFEPGDVLYGKLRPYLNKVIYATDAGVCTTEIIPIKSNLAINSKYLFYWLKHPYFIDYVTEVSHGVNMPRLGTDAGKKAPFVLAPLAEQRRIADKLDTVLTRVDAVQDRLARITPLLKRFRQSILAAATSGQLTEEWRKKNNSLHEVSLGECARFIDYRGKTPEKTSSGIPLITAKNVKAGYLNIDPQEFIADNAYDAWMTRGIPKKGDVLITTEAPLGNVTLINWDYKFALAQRLICLNFDEKIIGAYAAIALQSYEFQKKLNEQSSGSTVAGIKASRLKELTIPLVSLEEQTEIVRRVELLMGYADRLEARLQAAQTATERLTPALLAKAFRGELVPQDPSDEPAAELLRRLREARAAATPTKPKRGRKGASA